MASNDEQRSATTIFTTAAQSIAARLIANKTTAKFTKAEISTTNLFNQSVTELQVLTSLDNVQQTADINTVTVINDSTVDVNIAIDQTKAPNDYQMNSVGLFAVDGDGKEVLYSVTVLKDPVYIHQDAMGSALGIDLETVVGQSSNVDLSINPAGAVTNEALKVTLADYVKTDDVEKLIPATVIDGSKPADFKEAVTLEKGAVDGAGNAIATTKNLADGDATTLKAAKAYADTQASDKVKTANTDNWQKTKVTGDDGGNKYSFTTANTTDLVAAIQALPLGYHTFYCQAGVQGNPSSQAVRGIAEITTAGANPLGVGYLTDSTGAFWSFYVDSSGLKLKRSADADAIDPSVIVKTTLTATDDVLNLDYGSYTISGPLPKNAPDLENTGINWGTLVVLKTLSGANKTLEYRDVKGNVLINILSGKPLTWSGWHMPNQDSLAISAGANKIAANGNTFVPLAINVATGEICLPDGTAITLSLPGGVKLGDHMLNISATDGLTIDNQAYFTAVADEATAASKAAADPLHNYTTEE